MQSYQTFIFDSYDFDPASGRIELRYSLDDDIRFVEILTLPSNYKLLLEPVSTPSARRRGEPRSRGQTTNYKLEQALLALHLIGGISYFKTCIPPSIEVRSGSLTSEQATFWNTVYERGLGEFCYKNNLTPSGFVHFPSAPLRSAADKLKTKTQTRKTLVPIGGGKDSVVTIEKLRNEGKDMTLLRLGSHPLITKLVEVTGLPCITIGRQLSSILFDLNAQGALNGHVPITAYLSWLCVVVAELFGFEEIAMSCEKSASVGNVRYQGVEINHQWSKSEEFERIFQDYIRTSIDPHLRYQSPLRGMTELEIVSEFVKHPQYFPVATSCNVNWKLTAQSSLLKARPWCRKCPKCAFVFTMLAAFLPRETIEGIFGGNLFDDASLSPLYEELLGLRDSKPFECVGTPEETREAFRMIHERGEFDDTPIMHLCASVT